jgi:hypothetical protein
MLKNRKPGHPALVSAHALERAREKGNTDACIGCRFAGEGAAN